MSRSVFKKNRGEIQGRTISAQSAEGKYGADGKSGFGCGDLPVLRSRDPFQRGGYGNRVRDRANAKRFFLGGGNGISGSGASTGLATIGAGIAVAVAGSAALGAISEDSKLLGKTLIFVGLAEGIAIYGLIISIMIMNKV